MIAGRDGGSGGGPAWRFGQWLGWCAASALVAAGIVLAMTVARLLWAASGWVLAGIGWAP